MIAETICVKGSARGVEYNFKDDSLHIDSNALIIDDYLSKKEMAKEINEQFNSYEQYWKDKRANATDLRTKIVISPDKECSKDFEQKDWEDLAKKQMEKMDIDYQNHPYYIQLHRDTNTPHLHIEISCVNLQGERVIKSQRIGEKSGKVADIIAKERGWKTAKEMGEEKRRTVGKHINEVLKKEKVTDFKQFTEAMEKKGYLVKLSHSETQGTYGMRIIPKELYQPNPSPRLNKSGQGYKLSQIEKTEGKKAKFNIEEIKNQMKENIREKELEQKREEHQNRNRGMNFGR